MAKVKTWIASAALVGGAGGGGALAFSAAEPQTPAPAPAPAVALPDARHLQQQIDALLAEDQALKRAVSRARSRLAGQVRAGEKSLAVLRHRIVLAQAELQRARSAQAAVVVTSIRPAAPATVTQPAAHATTGASGGGHGEHEDGEHEGGDDD